MSNVDPRFPIRRYTAEELYSEITEEKKSFWDTVHPRFMARDVTKEEIRKLLRMALVATAGSYRLVNQLFNSPPEDYKRLMNFLSKHDLMLDFRKFRRRSTRSHAA